MVIHDLELNNLREIVSLPRLEQIVSAALLHHITHNKVKLNKDGVTEIYNLIDECLGSYKKYGYVLHVDEARSSTNSKTITCTFNLEANSNDRNCDFRRL